MPKSEGLSCEICLRADEPEAMTWVAIPHSIYKTNRSLALCRDCIRAIVDADAGEDEPQPIEAEKKDPQ